jgi:hypothetical protein
MAAVFGNVGSSAGEVNSLHANSDVDSSTIAQHHTLGPQPNQASPGDHSHDGKSSKKINYSDILGAPDSSAGSAGAALSSGIATLNFGSGSVSAQTTLTGHSGITANSVILVALRVIATAEHTAEDMLVDPIRVAVKNLVVGTGFTIDGRMDNAQANGTYKVNWVIIS